MANMFDKLPKADTLSTIQASMGNYTMPDATQKAAELAGALVNRGKLNEFTNITASSVTIDGVTSTSITRTSKSVTTVYDPSKTTTDDSQGEIISEEGGGDFRVRLRSLINTEDVVIFWVSPTVSESRQAQYTATDIVHHPGQLQIYKSSTARGYGIEAQLISRTAAEAQANIDTINLIRSWTMPYYGEGTQESELANGEAGSRFGAPPDILELQGYGNSKSSRIIGPVPVVLTSYSWTWPNDVDYIKSSGGEPFPVIVSIHIDVVEALSPKQYSSFSLAAFKKGDLSGAYTAQTYRGVRKT